MNGASPLRVIDLFCGIGGFRIAAENMGWECVFSSDINEPARQAYKANFGEAPAGDIHEIDAAHIPDHDVLLGGFPCQPFSIIGGMRGFDDTRGTLFFEIARILKAKRPHGFVLENVKQLVGHNGGKTISRMMDVLHGLGYRNAEYRILNALNFGLPQKRERVIIVGTYDSDEAVRWPHKTLPMKPLSKILQKNVDPKFFASKHILRRRKKAHKSAHPLSIWHENKGGHVSSYPYSCALRAGASYNYLLVNGERRLTPREMLRLQGFPDWYKQACNDSQTRKQAGNAVPVPLIQAVLESNQELFHGALVLSA